MPLSLLDPADRLRVNLVRGTRTDILAAAACQAADGADGHIMIAEDLAAQSHAGQTARGKDGLGIGLALVRTLVDMHAGSVEIFSAGQDEGTRVTVELPLAEQRVQHATVPAPLGHADAGAASRRVLVVEDNRDGLETLLALLDMLGYEVAGAADGRGL